MSSSSDRTPVNEYKEKVYRNRVLQLLNAGARQYPSIFVLVDLWRPTVLTTLDDHYTDQQVIKWVRMAENVPAFKIETRDRFYQKDVGVIFMNQDWVLFQDIYGLESGDHIIINGEAWIAVGSAQQAGVEKVRVDHPKSTFIMPSRTEPTYRQMSLRARIT